jgi:zinc transport system substrate-binding protein
MRFTKLAILATTMLSSSMTLAYADVKVVASIKPVHSLVSAVMEGVAKPNLLVEGAASPHTYSLKPSQAKQLQDADIVFWMSHDLEAFLENSIENIAQKAVSVPLIESHNLTKLNFREGGAFAAHGHDDHDDKHDDDHGDKHDDDHGDKHDDDHGEMDPHVWLDPQNAKALVHEIEEQLAKIDPKNAEIYEANASIIMKKLDNLTNEIDVDLSPVRGRGYVVFHDAYQYFEKRFGVSAIGSITVSPEVMPGAERVRELQEKVRELDATCVFSEPQFQPKLVATVTENTNAGTGVLDPLGASLEDGPELYFKLIRNMANSLKGCLMKTS